MANDSIGSGIDGGIGDGTDKDTADVLELSRAWARAIVANDAAAIGAYMTDDWVIVSDRGISDRTAFLSVVASGALAHSAMDLVEGTARARRYGDTIVLTARVTNTAHYGGQDFLADEWTTDVFVQVGGTWKCALSHITGATDG